MAERFEVVAIVDYNSGLSWRFKQDEMDYWFDRLGVEEAKAEMREQLECAMVIAADSFIRARGGKP